MFDAESLFFSPFTHVLTHTLATELTKKKRTQTTVCTGFYDK